MFLNILIRTKLNALIHFYRKHIVLMKLWYKNNSTPIASYGRSYFSNSYFEETCIEGLFEPCIQLALLL